MDITKPAIIVMCYNVRMANRMNSRITGISETEEDERVGELEMRILIAYSDEYKIIKDEYLYVDSDILHHIIAKRKPEDKKQSQDKIEVEGDFLINGLHFDL